MKKIIVLMLCCGFSIGVMAQDNAKQVKIKELMELTGMSNMGKQIMQNMMNIIKQQNPFADLSVLDEFTTEANINELMSLIIPIYDRYFTTADLEAMITFYKTPAGKKVISTMPMLTRDAMDAGRALGEKMGQKIMEKMQQQGK